MSELGFNRKASTPEALTGDPGTIYFTPDTHKIIMGGKVYGGTEIPKSHTDYLQELYESHQKKIWTPSLTVSSEIISPGQEITVTIRSEVSGILAPLDSLPAPTFGYIYGQTFTETKPGIYTASFKTGSGAGILRSSVDVTYSGETRTLISTLPCYGDIYWGWSVSETLTDLSSLRNSQSRGPSSTISGKYEFSSSGVGYYYFLVPTGTPCPEKPRVTEDSIPVYFIKQEQGPSGYTVYRIDDLQAPGNHLFTWH